MCDGGNFFQMGDTPSYWSITTSNTVVYNMDVRGVGAVAAAHVASIHIHSTAENCKLFFCTVQSRLGDAIAHDCFYDEGGESSAIACRVYDITNGAAVSGFRKFKKVISCEIDTIEITASGALLFYACKEVQNSKVKPL